MAKPKPRPDNPRPIRLTARDKAILQAIHLEFEEVMALRQLHRRFFAPATLAAARLRLRALFENRYLLQPNADEMHRAPEMVYWLDARGLEVVAGLGGDNPRPADLRKRRLPQWAKLEHDLAVNDVHLDVLEAVEGSPTLELKSWVTEKTMRRWGDRVAYRDSGGRRQHKRLVPDGFFTVRRPAPDQPGKVESHAFLLEVDMATHTASRFGDRKVLPGLAYLKSPLYAQRFGVAFGRWLVVVKAGPTRLEHLVAEAKRAGEAGAFYFTTFDALSPETVFRAPIWWQAGEPEPVALISRANLVKA